MPYLMPTESLVFFEVVRKGRKAFTLARKSEEKHHAYNSASQHSFSAIVKANTKV